MTLKDLQLAIVEMSKQFTDVESMVEFVNVLRQTIHSVSPLKANPVDCVLWIKSENVLANDYNPNSVATPEMKLLQHSIEEDGFTQPIVAWNGDKSNGGISYEVVDGFHRNKVGRGCENVSKDLFGYLPLTLINVDRQDRADRIASTIRHNRARGKHGVSKMSEIVLELKRRNWSDKKVSKELGMDQDEVLRLTQISGIAEMFADKEFSEAWEATHLQEEDFDGDREALD